PESDEESASDSDSASYVSDSDGNSDVDSDCQSPVREPCKYYNNNGRCRDGDKCSYWHVCKYALNGNCRYGSKYLKLTDGRFYQWQLNDGNDWKDINNDHVIEAQYSLPHTKSIKIYNTPYGAVSIDFNKMRVYRKSLRVRRLDDGNTEWIWYCTLRRKWNKYGDKDSKGNPSPVKNSDIERKFQSNPKSSFTFCVGAETLEIRFREMRQVGKNRKRKVTRRPLYRQQQASAQVSQAAAAIQNVSLGSKPQWQFEGDSGAWHTFKHRNGGRTECSVTSEDIERAYQQNHSGSMTFKVNRHTYKLDFGVKSPHNGGEKQYEWQLSVGNQWLRIDNDHVIETHYCQPGAKGITINTSQGSVFIDFDKLQTRDAALNVHRRSLLPAGQAEDMGWYFRDDQLWREYGSQSSNTLSSSISSRDVERQFTLNPQGSFSFTVGSTSYTLDFSSMGYFCPMTQANGITGLRRNVRRRPKFTSKTGSIHSTPVFPTASASQLPDGGYKWEFMGDEGEWTEYQARKFKLQLKLRVHWFITGMHQTNDRIGTRRAVRRTADNGSQEDSSAGSLPRWQFQDVDGKWKNYCNGNGQCSVSSDDIELQYQQNPSGTIKFNTRSFCYELNFTAMTQRNLSTNTTRPVRRLDH
ncbi:Poly [ADP-ribose] polymerase 12, partial [Nibea albiflora]